MAGPLRVAQARSAAWSIDAPAESVYRVLSDDVVEHPRITPKPFFESIEVEEGGRGAGTVYRVTLRVWRTRTTLRMFVSEPEPGRLLREEDPAAGVVTTFALRPAGQRTQVEIATEWRPRGGLRGLAERLLHPRIARNVYKKELALLPEHLAWTDPEALA